MNDFWLPFYIIMIFGSVYVVLTMCKKNEDKVENLVDYAQYKCCVNQCCMDQFCMNACLGGCNFLT